jgi:hypothetical protein
MTSAVGVPAIPPALEFMLFPNRGQLNGKTLIKHLDKCADIYHDCEICTMRDTCAGFYDFCVEMDLITNWKGVTRAITRLKK